MRSTEIKIALAVLLACLPFGRAIAEADFGSTLFNVGGNAKMTFSQGGAPTAAIACAKCHGGDAEGVSEGSLAAPRVTWKALSGASYDADVLRRVLETGRAPDGRQLKAQMPRYSLGQAETLSLLAFLQGVDRVQRVGLSADTVHIALPPQAPATRIDSDFLTGLEAATKGKIPWGRHLSTAEVEQAFVHIDPSGISFTVDVAGRKKSLSFCGNQRQVIDAFVADQAKHGGRITVLPGTFLQADNVELAAQLVVLDTAADVQPEDAVVLPDVQRLPQNWPRLKLRRIYALGRADPARLTLLKAHAAEIVFGDVCANLPGHPAGGSARENGTYGHAIGVAIVEVLAAVGRNLTKYRFVQAATGRTFESGARRWHLVETGTALPMAIELQHFSGN